MVNEVERDDLLVTACQQLSCCGTDPLPRSYMDIYCRRHDFTRIVGSGDDARAQ